MTTTLFGLSYGTHGAFNLIWS